MDCTATQKTSHSVCEHASPAVRRSDIRQRTSSRRETLFTIVEDYEEHCAQAKVDRDMQMVCQVADTGIGMLRLWTNQKAVVVSHRDTRLEEYQFAVSALAREGFAVATRRSGGTAVAHIDGVLNLSWAFPIAGTDSISIHRCYQVMLTPLIAYLRALSLNAEVGEVKGAYCEGSHDVSLQGLKIAGTAQRVCNFGQNRVALSHLSLNVSAVAKEIEEAVEKFYLLATGKPSIERNRTTSLSAHAAGELSVDVFAKGMIDFLIDNPVVQDSFVQRYEYSR